MNSVSFLFYKECPTGYFGPDCRYQCQCENGAECENVGGACSCLPGWIGTYCEKCKRGLTCRSVRKRYRESHSYVINRTKQMQV